VNTFSRLFALPSRQNMLHREPPIFSYLLPSSFKTERGILLFGSPCDQISLYHPLPSGQGNPKNPSPIKRINCGIIIWIRRFRSLPLVKGVPGKYGSAWHWGAHIRSQKRQQRKIRKRMAEPFYTEV
jgi:hypothetical protein